MCHYLCTKLGLELSQRGHATYLRSIGLGLGLVDSRLDSLIASILCSLDLRGLDVGGLQAPFPCATSPRSNLLSLRMLVCLFPEFSI